MHYRTRFAPSPTGKLHLGHALAAWVAYEVAAAGGGGMVLRFEDLDASRVRAESYDEIAQDLDWLGISWMDEPLLQSQRGWAYDDALERLKNRGVLYPCFCTRREIEQEIRRMGAAPQGEMGPVYPGTCRHLSQRKLAEMLDKRPSDHVWRLNADAANELCGPLYFTDLWHGKQQVIANLLGDVVLARKKGEIAYHLAVVVDDAYQHISHVTRGEDLLSSTHVHRLLQHLLDCPVPMYLHHPLCLDDAGKRLAKRHDALSLATLREAGKTAKSLRSELDSTIQSCFNLVKKSWKH